MSEYKGLLAVVVTGPDDCQTAKDQYLSTLDGDHFAYAAQGPEDARRLVASWNACTGIETGDLETIPSGKIKRALTGMGVLVLHFNEAEARATEAEMQFGRIIKCATPHPDDTDEDRKRDLRHIESIARVFLDKAKP